MSGATQCRLGQARCRSLRRGCGGAVAIEFALVFLIFFMLFYGIVAYGFVLAMEQNLTMAAEEGARAAVQDAPDEATRLDRAQKTAKLVLSWLPGAGVSVPLPTADDCGDSILATRCVKVVVSYDYANNPIVPELPWLGIKIPASLGAKATVQYVQF